MSDDNRAIVSVGQRGVVASVSRQIAITEKVLGRIQPDQNLLDVFNVPADGTFEEAVQRVRPGGLITIDAGRYILDVGVIISKPLKIKGMGSDLTVIESSVKGTILSVETDGLFAMENVGVLRAGEQTGNLLSISAREVVMKFCAVTGNSVRGEYNNYLSGIRVGSSIVVLVEDTIVTCCDFGIVVGKCAEIMLQRNRCEMNRRPGILFSDSATGTAVNNICSRNNHAGILIEEQSVAILIGNHCEGNEVSGIMYYNSTGTVENNSCNLNWYSGIEVNRQAKVNLIDNRCEQNRYAGISFYASAGTAENNVCSRNTFYGIAVNQSEANLIGNRCEENGSTGITYSEDSSGTAENNQCIRNKSGGIYVAPSAAATCKNNQTDQP